MKHFVRRIFELIKLFGIEPWKTFQCVKLLPLYASELSKLKEQQKNSEDVFPFGKLYPCLMDRFAEGGTARGHYFHQDLLVARKIFQNKPELHVDIGSRIDGFVAHVASFREITIIDIRDMSNRIPNVKFTQADMMSKLEESFVNYCDSLSCLRAVEHFGLGRYGDPIRYDGYRVGLDNMYLMLKNGGKFYLSLPIGPQRIEFNAHRVFSLLYLLTLVNGKYKIDSFSFVDDKGELFENIELTSYEIERNFGCYYGCGILEMTKL